MKKPLLMAISFLLFAASYGQTVTQRLQKAFQQFESDSQLRHAISSLYVIDAETGKVVYDKNSQVGLAPASTQKIVAAATAFELLGKSYQYKTNFYNANPDKEAGENIILVRGTGDPTFGTWRYSTADPASIFSKLKTTFKANGIDPSKASLVVIPYSKFDMQVIPDGWIWQDVGNYYGAGSSDFNWKENQADIFLSSGENIGDPVEIKNYDSLFQGLQQLNNSLKSAGKGSGDNAYYYFGYSNSYAARSLPPFLKGTIPVNEKDFKISISVSDPEAIFQDDYAKFRKSTPNQGWSAIDIATLRLEIDSLNSPGAVPLYTHYSPSLDSIIYWFLKKSINLYGEALVKTFAYEKQGFGSTDSGVAIVKKFWKDNGLDDEELNLYDGSGLSPLNRITTHAQVEILKYAKTKDWFKFFYEALPEFNGMKTKSGTISDVKGFCGYHKAKDGKEYIFSFLVNNYSGKTSGVVNKMYKVLDELK